MTEIQAEQQRKADRDEVVQQYKLKEDECIQKYQSTLLELETSTQRQGLELEATKLKADQKEQELLSQLKQCQTASQKSVSKLQTQLEQKDLRMSQLISQRSNLDKKVQDLERELFKQKSQLKVAGQAIFAITQLQVSTTLVGYPATSWGTQLL